MRRASPNRTLRTAAIGTASNKPAKPRISPPASTARITTTGGKPTLFPTSRGVMTLPSSVCVTTNTMTTPRIGPQPDNCPTAINKDSVTPIAVPMNGIMLSNPLNNPITSAPSMPTMDSPSASKTPSTIATVNCPRTKPASAESISSINPCTRS